MLPKPTPVASTRAAIGTQDRGMASSLICDLALVNTLPTLRGLAESLNS